MKKHLAFFFFTLVAVMGYAQDVTFDLTKQKDINGKVTVTQNECTITYDMATAPNAGAYIYPFGDTLYKLKVTATKKIIAIELKGCAEVKSSSNGTNILVEKGTTTEWMHNPGSISVWKGSDYTVQFGAEASPRSVYTVQGLRVWLDGSNYVPNTPWEEEEEEEEVVIKGIPFVRTLSVPQNGKAVKMAIVAAKQFEALAKEYALWKTQQGYDVEEVYVEDYSQNGTLKDDAWAKSIQARLKEIKPAFVLIMGGHKEVPSFTGTKPYDTRTYITDFFYGEYTGDYFPEAYVGRFSGRNEAEIRAQMAKTQYMAQLSATDGQWLNKSVALHNPSDNIPNTITGHKYVKNYYSHFDGVSVSEGTASIAADNINKGVAVVSYFGHGSIGGLGGASFSNDHVNTLQNQGKYPIVLAMTCLSGTFDYIECLAEKMQRKTDGGSVAYIGATRESFDAPNAYFMKGGVKDDQYYPGFMASMFPISDEDPLNVHCRTIGEAMALGSYSVNVETRDYAEYSAEYYELFGDPTYQPYIQTPKTMTVRTDGTAVAGHQLKVTAAPQTVVCVSQGRKIVGVTLTDAKGHGTLKLAKDATEGEAVLYGSAPGYTDWHSELYIAQNDGREDPMPGVGYEVNPVLQSTDVIDATNAQTIPDRWNVTTSVTGQSGATYSICASSSENNACVNMRNDYKPCGIVTTQSGGYVRKVTIDWTHMTGPADCISVFGSNQPYSSTSDVWDEAKCGTLLGQIVKGKTNTLIIYSNYTHVALRAENLDCMMNSISIGWGTATFEAEKQKLAPSMFDFDDYTRHRVLIEKFTGQNCHACAGDDAYVKSYIEEQDLYDKVYEIRHYGYGGDPITQDYLRLPALHTELAGKWFVGAYPTYLVDRCNPNGERCENATDFQYRGNVLKNLDCVNQRLARPCNLSLSLDGSTYNPATGEVRIVVSGKTAKELPDLRLNVFLTQNKIVAYQSNTTNDYEHNGVSRDKLTTDINGDILTVREDGVFQKIYTYTIPKRIGNFYTVDDQMDVVVFVNSWDNYGIGLNPEKNFENSEVHNTAVVRVKSLPFDALAPELPNISNQVVGDINGDGQVNVADLTTLVNIILGTDEGSGDRNAADLNHDGKVQVDDYTRLVQIILQH